MKRLALSSPRYRPLALLSCVLLAACGGGMVDGVAEPYPDAPGLPQPAPVLPFVPSADDLPAPTTASYPYAGTSLLQMALRYQPTPVSGAGYYFSADGTCSRQDTPPVATYPNGLVTLDTVNLDVSKTDQCEPEIMVRARIGDGPSAWESDARMRLRGSSTREARLKSYRVKLAGSAKWMNETTFQLNKHPFDLSRVRNKLAFDLMQTVPHLPSLGTQFVHMSYDDGQGTPVNMGLYTHVEKMGSKDYLQRRGWVAGSNVYKAEDFSFEMPEGGEFALKPDGNAGPDFEKVLSIESDSGDHRAIVHLTRALGDETQDFNTVFRTHFNTNNYLSWLASVILLGNSDTQNQNYGLYQPLGSEKFYFTPWDYDGALGYADQPGVEKYPDWNRGISNWWINLLHRRFMEQPGNLALLKAAVDEIHDKYLTRAHIKTLLDGYRPLVEPLLATQPDLSELSVSTTDTSAPMDQWSREYARLVEVIDDNYRDFVDSLQRPMPFWLTERADDSGALNIEWGWPQPFHPQGQAIRYSALVARVETGQTPFSPSSIVREQHGIDGTHWNAGALAPGKYLIKVLASDPQGHTTYGFDTITLEGAQLFGVHCVNMPGATPCN
ncbi:CotH kinase family protein [Comamonas sp. NLF-1-9]|uniref:CotH kinase family protein n=1 Tax=Comamonas sp. NLF-1-9 TaxID=2853163 RepID=UPI001C44E16E|nr:CotH kinase family protein [Comamonas sp. NLF-1-9]QXL83257.1 CotH kinase family protein [Comamonas sp. NLF-1-9]